MQPGEERKRVWAWALYDWANSAFATTVTAGFFPLFFKQYWSAGADATLSTFRLGTANSLASVVVALIAPVLGAIADRGNARKRMLASFTILGVVATAALFFVSQGAWRTAVAMYVAANVGFAASNVFYDALIVNVTDDANSDRVSSLGYAMGYLGGGLLFAINVAMSLKPQLFGIPDAATAIRISFLTVAVWWVVFTVPLMRFVPETRAGGRAVEADKSHAIADGLSQFVRTIKDLTQLRPLLLFLIGYFFYIDAIHTIARMGVDYGLSLGFAARDLITALLLVQFIGFPSALFFGRIAGRIGAKRGIYIGIATYGATCVFAFRMTTEWHFYVLAVAIGLVQGGVQALSRSFYSRIIPKSKSGEFFGFYNMLGKFSTVIGPILMGWVGMASGNPRYSVLSLLALLLCGCILLVKVDEHSARVAADLHDAA